jgi:methionyl-tRNA formyltransferase
MMRTVFLGTPAIAVPTLQRILADGHQVVGVFTQPDRPAGRGKQMQAPPVKQAALACGLPVYQPTKIRTPEFETLFRTLDPEVAIIVAYGRIIPDKLLAIPRAGFINLHFSLLPAYRGAAPINWALINGEPQTGITTMRIVAELDAGDILLQEVVPIDAAETAVDLATRLSAQGAALLSRTLQQLDAITPRPQNHCQATFAPILRREDGLINWALMTAPEIIRRLRGLQPWPGVYTLWQGTRLVIAEAVAVAVTEEEWLQPGRIVQADKNGIVVSCAGATHLVIQELQLEGRKRLKATDFLNGIKLAVGSSLGN